MGCARDALAICVTGAKRACRRRACVRFLARVGDRCARPRAYAGFCGFMASLWRRGRARVRIRKPWGMVCVEGRLVWVRRVPSCDEVQGGSSICSDVCRMGWQMCLAVVVRRGGGGRMAGCGRGWLADGCSSGWMGCAAKSMPQKNRILTPEPHCPSARRKPHATLPALSPRRPLPPAPACHSSSTNLQTSHAGRFCTPSSSLAALAIGHV